MNPTATMDSMEVIDANNEIAQSSIQDLSSSSSSSEDSGDGLHDPEPDVHDETIAESNARNANSNSPSKRISANKQLSYFLGFKNKTPPQQSESAPKSAIQSNESTDGGDVKSGASDGSPENSPVPPPLIELTMEPESTREHFNRTVIAGRQNFTDVPHPEGDTAVITGTTALDAVRFESGSTQTFTRSQLVQESSDELRTILRESLGKPTALTCGYANSQSGNPVNPLRITAVAMLSEATDLIVAVTIAAKPGCKLVAGSYGIKRVAVFSQSGKQILMEKYFDIVQNNVEEDAKLGARRAEVVESKGCCFSRPKVSRLPASVAKMPAEEGVGQSENDAVIVAPIIDTEALVIEDNEPRELNLGSPSESDRSIDALTASLPDIPSVPLTVDTTPMPTHVETATLPLQIDTTPAPIPVMVAPVSPPVEMVSVPKSVDTVSMTTPLDSVSVIQPIEVAPVPIPVPPTPPVPPAPVITKPILKPIEVAPITKPLVAVPVLKPEIIDEVPEMVESPKKKAVTNSALNSQPLVAVKPREVIAKKMDDDYYAPGKKDSKPLVAGSTDCCGNPKPDDCCAPAKTDTQADVVSVAGNMARAGSPSEEKSGPVGSDGCCPLNDVDEDDDHECCPSGGTKTKKKTLVVGGRGDDCCGKKKEDDCCVPKKETAANSSGCCAADKKKGSVPVVGSENERKGFCFGKPKAVPMKKDAPSELVKKTAAPPAAKTGLQYEGCSNTGFCVFVPYCVWPWEASTYKPTTLPRSSPNYRPLAKNRI